MKCCIVAVSACLLLTMGISQANGEITIETVIVGNPGNEAELSGAGAGGVGANRHCGKVDYVYRIGTYEVTAGQYTAFLNAVATADPYELYDENMMIHQSGCQIVRAGAPGSYTYSVAEDWKDRPVNNVTWADAARFANWMHNGQPTGAQDASTTEDGSYTLNGIMDREELMIVWRNRQATWTIPSENEWYKAAYHKNDGITGNYWIYPTSSNEVPDNALWDPDDGNNANYIWEDGTPTLGAPYWRTVVGDFEKTESPYGTFDQGGNVIEWNEMEIDFRHRGMRGGSFQLFSWYMKSSYRVHLSMVDFGRSDLGFRLARGHSIALFPFDREGDGEVGIDDYETFEECLTGPVNEIELSDLCLNYDADEDGDVDLADFSEFQILYMN